MDGLSTKVHYVDTPAPGGGGRGRGGCLWMSNAQDCTSAVVSSRVSRRILLKQMALTSLITAMWLVSLLFALLSFAHAGAPAVSHSRISAHVAFLQSHGYTEGKKYVCFRHPVTKEWMYYSQSGPIYGESSAPRRWEDTVAPWLVSIGFVRGENEKSVFHHPTRDLVLVLYVDDALVDGEEDDIKWLFKAMDKRFECKPAEWLGISEPLDYLGMDVSIDDTHIYLSMHKYIENTLKLLEYTNLKPVRTPINADIDASSPILKPHMLRKFMTAVGCLGWLCNTGRPDIAYAHSQVAQHLATPTESAMHAVKRIYQYLAGTKRLCLSAPLNEPDVDPTTVNLRHAKSQPSAKDWRSSLLGIQTVYAAGNATQDFLHLSYVAEELGIGFELPFNLQIDNTAAEAFANDTVIKTKLKHIDCRQDWVRILRDRTICTPTHVDTKLNVADLFTKILPADDFERLTRMIMPRSCPIQSGPQPIVQVAHMYPIWTA